MRKTKKENIFITGSLAFDRVMNFPDLFARHILPDKLTPEQQEYLDSWTVGT